jgi:hypothetical protein
MLPILVNWCANPTPHPNLPVYLVLGRKHLSLAFTDSEGVISEKHKLFTILPYEERVLNLRFKSRPHSTSQTNHMNKYFRH